MIFFREVLLNWFIRCRRDFPWRNEKDPYKILVSEILLQRTKAEQVSPIYSQFINRFPNIKALAQAPVDEILLLVGELGLFWRSRLMKKMATTITTEYDGSIPSERRLLLEIPGIGDYIADAVTVFAFGDKRTVIDSNVVRLVSRFFGIQIHGEMRRKVNFVKFCQTLSNDLEAQEVRNFNWAIIDHSAAICRSIPLCNTCPLAAKCNYKRKLQVEIN